jgi:hypothetical protein
MHHMRSSISFFPLVLVGALFVAVILAAPPEAGAQATISTGSVQGAMVDPKGAVVISAKVTITNKDTGQRLEPEVTSAGTYNSGHCRRGGMWFAWQRKDSRPSNTPLRWPSA